MAKSIVLVCTLLLSAVMATQATIPSLLHPKTPSGAATCAAGDLACACKTLLSGAWIASPRSRQRACNVTWPFEGRDRSFLVFFPPGYNGAGTAKLQPQKQQQQQRQQQPALWLHLHGMASTNWSHTTGPAAQGALVDAERLRIAAAAARHGAIAVAPQGSYSDPACQVWGVQFWSPRSLLPACVDSRADDAGFVAGLAAALPARLGADPKRVFVSGFSNGAMLALQLLCARPRDAARLRAVALLAPALGADYAANKCAVGRADGGGSVRVPPVLLLHGTADQTLPFAGGVRISNTTMLGADATAAFLASRAGCGAGSSSSTVGGGAAPRPAYPPPGPAPSAPYWRQLSGKQVACSSYCAPPPQQQQQAAAAAGGGACARSVAMCSVAGGSHSVPEFGAPGEVTEMVWDFFDRATC